MMLLCKFFAVLACFLGAEICFVGGVWLLPSGENLLCYGFVFVAVVSKVLKGQSWSVSEQHICSHEYGRYKRNGDTTAVPLFIRPSPQCPNPPSTPISCSGAM